MNFEFVYTRFTIDSSIEIRSYKFDKNVLLYDKQNNFISVLRYQTVDVGNLSFVIKFKSFRSQFSNLIHEDHFWFQTASKSKEDIVKPMLL